MKRSEMIQLIHDKFNYEWIQIEYLDQGSIEYILDIIEEAGMLPPLTQDQLDEDLACVGKWKHSWEPEKSCIDCGQETSTSARCQECWNSRNGE